MALFISLGPLLADRFLPAGCGLLLLALACPVAAQPPSLSQPLLFTATRDGNADLYLHSPSGLRRLTDAAGADNWGVWSPDGEHIAFQSQRDGNYELYVMAADGANPRNLSRHPLHDGLPVWSPDGSRLAFFSGRGFDYPERGPIPGHIYAVDAGGAELERLTVEPLSSTLGPSSWSPDGRHLLLTRTMSDVSTEENGNGRLFRLEVASGNEHPLTDGTHNAGGGLYSPDGLLIAHYEEGATSAVVVVIDSAGGARRVLTAEEGWHYPYAWSEDGKWLTVTSVDAAGEFSVRAFGLDGPTVSLPVDTALSRPREASWRPGVPN